MLGCNEKTVLSNILHHRFPPPRISPRRRICSSLFRKDLFIVFQITTICSFSFLIRFSMNNPGLPCGIPRAQARTTLRKIRLCGSACSHPLFGDSPYILKKSECLVVGLIESRFAKTLMRSVDQSRIHSRERLVGLSGLEPPTSRLSGGCSNQLSYKPM